MVVASSKGNKVFHYPNCKYAKNINKENLIIFNNKDDARNNGYKHCTCCSRIIKYYKEDKTIIDKLLIDNGMTMYIDDDTMYIDNVFSSWKIIVNPKGYNLILYHANTESYHKLKKVNGRLIHTYHLQKYKGKNDIMSMIQYIANHDKWKNDKLESYKNLPQRTKKQKANKRKAAKSYKRIKTRNVLNLLEKIKCEEENKE